MNLTNYWYITMILFIILVILMVIRFGVQVSFSLKRLCCSTDVCSVFELVFNYKEAFSFTLPCTTQVSMHNQSRGISPLQYTVVLADGLGTIADFLFWGLILMCGYWFIFFKLQV
jgi:hypothetical protein